MPSAEADGPASAVPTGAVPSGTGDTASLSASAVCWNSAIVCSGAFTFFIRRRPRYPSSAAISNMTTNTMTNAAQRGSQMAMISAIISQKKNSEKRAVAAAVAKNALPRNASLSEADSSSLANSISERTRVERWTVASLTRSPRDPERSTSGSGVSGTAVGPVGWREKSGSGRAAGGVVTSVSCPRCHVCRDASRCTEASSSHVITP